MKKNVGLYSERAAKRSYTAFEKVGRELPDVTVDTSVIGTLVMIDAPGYKGLMEKIKNREEII